MARGRKPKVSYWASKGGFGFNFNGRPYVFQGPDDWPDGPTHKRAVLALTKLICQDAGKGTDDFLVSAALNAYRQHLTENKRGNARRFNWIGESFCDKYGKLRVAELRPYHLTDWLAKNTDRWGDTTRRAAGQAILSALAFCKRRGLIQSDPLAGRLEDDDLPAPVVRGEEARMSPELCQLIIDEAGHHSTLFAAFLAICRDTGCRPGELRKATPKHYRAARIVYKWNANDGITHKTARKTKRDRIVYLPPHACEVLDKLLAKHPAGALFHSGRSRLGWTQQALNHRWRYVVRRPAVVAYCRQHNIDPDNLKMYNYRHSWISTYLEKTGDYYGCAQLCGTSVKMLERRYGHPDSDKLHARYLSYMDGNPS
jgi:integrase